MQVLRAEVVDPTWHGYCPYVAIKQVSIPAGSDDALISSQLDDLLQEALLHAFLQQSIGDWGHRVVQAKAATLDRASGTPQFSFIALEYCAGGSLQRWLTRVMRNGPRADGTPRLPLMTRLAVAKLLLQGVAHMHSRNLVHMDLKPGNVLLRKRVSDGGQWQDVSVAVGDLGRVRFVGERVRAPVGTPGYMAPEVACANGMAPTAAQAANDIWSIGIVLLNLIGCAAVSALSMREVQAARILGQHRVQQPRLRAWVQGADDQLHQRGCQSETLSRGSPGAGEQPRARALGTAYNPRTPPAAGTSPQLLAYVCISCAYGSCSAL
jgi:serine/threonine protein kinase